MIKKMVSLLCECLSVLVCDKLSAVVQNQTFKFFDNCHEPQWLKVWFLSGVSAWVFQCVVSFRQLSKIKLLNSLIIVMNHNNWKYGFYLVWVLKCVLFVANFYVFVMNHNDWKHGFSLVWVLKCVLYVANFKVLQQLSGITIIESMASLQCDCFKQKQKYDFGKSSSKFLKVRGRDQADL